MTRYPVAMRVVAYLMTLWGLGYGGRLNADELDAYRWQSRLVVVAAPSLDDPAMKRQQAEAASDASGWADRQLLLLTIADGTLTGAGPGSAGQGGQILRRLGLSQERFSIVLIGLDGTVKMRRERPVTNQALYSLIDAMPMRREELRLRHKP